MNEKNESEGLAERLRLLYRAHDCENELPTHDDLVAKLDKITPEVREAIELGFFNGVYFISYREAEKMAEEGAELIEYFKENIEKALVEVEKDIVQEIKCYLEKDKGLSKEQETQGIMEEYNEEARLIFKGFKANLEDFYMN